MKVSVRGVECVELLFQRLVYFDQLRIVGSIVPLQRVVYFRHALFHGGKQGRVAVYTLCHGEESLRDVLCLDIYRFEPLQQ